MMSANLRQTVGCARAQGKGSSFRQKLNESEREELTWLKRNLNRNKKVSMRFYRTILGEFILYVIYMLVMVFILLKLLTVPQLTEPIEGKFVSGDFFRSQADFVVYSRNQGKMLDKVLTLQAGAAVFVRTMYLRYMEGFQRRNKVPYILITHDDDLPIPGEYSHLLEDPYLVRWFGQNMEIGHPKIEPAPIGIANSRWPHGKQNILSEIASEQELIYSKRTDNIYVNFLSGTFKKRREPVKRLFCENGLQLPIYCVQTRTNWPTYLKTIGKSKWVLSPRGNGIDCHRTWEAIAMGAIPIVESSGMDSLYDGERVLIVPSFNNLTLNVLQKGEEKLKDLTTENSKIHRSYWKQRIHMWKSMAAALHIN